MGREDQRVVHGGASHPMAFSWCPGAAGTSHHKLKNNRNGFSHRLAGQEAANLVSVSRAPSEGSRGEFVLFHLLGAQALLGLWPCPSSLCFCGLRSLSVLCVCFCLF